MTVDRRPTTPASGRRPRPGPAHRPRRPRARGRRPGSSARRATPRRRAGMTFICAGCRPAARSGSGGPRPRWGGSGAGRLERRLLPRRAAPRKRASTGFGLRPWKGMAPWAMAPVKSTRSRSAPLETLQTSPSSGSQQMAASIAVRPPGGDEVPGAGHHPLLVDEGGQHDAAGERALVGHGPGREQRRHQAGLHVGAAPSVEAAVADLGPERVGGPRVGVALGDDVGVPLEHQRRAGAAALHDGVHVGAAGGDRDPSPASSRTTRSWWATSRAAPSSLRPVGGSYTLGTWTSAWTTSTSARGRCSLVHHRVASRVQASSSREHQ